MVFNFFIGDKNFNTKKELIEHIQTILYKYTPGEKLDKKDFNFVRELLNFHPKSKEKIGCGVKSIKVDKAKEGTTCFYILRNDDSYDDFSFGSCIRNYKKRV